jgi:4-diphosphocytidyl-2-C-methyl-D-erythritol kinase
MAVVSEAAPAKVNLFLHVTGRRADGYHLLDSLAVFAGCADTIEAAPAEELSLSLAGPGANGLAAESDNLVLRAARALPRARGAALHLQKRLPVAAGLGGGSADAAATLRALDRLWELRLGAEGLRRVAAGLGADVPVCVASRPARMGGVGELLSPAPALPAFGLALANPRLPLATPEVFSARGGCPFSAPAELPFAWGDALAMAVDLRALSNDLQAPAISLCPPVAEVLAAMAAQPGCLLARMSGSGATCFGLFETAAAAEAAAAALPAAWWRWGGAPAAPSAIVEAGDPG